MRELELRLYDLDDDVVCSAIADWLEEKGDPRSEDAREVAAVKCVIPVKRPMWARAVWGEGFECDHVMLADGEEPDDGCLPVTQSLAKGKHWEFEWHPADGVSFDTFGDDAAPWSKAPWGWGFYHWKPRVAAAADAPEEEIRLHFEACRRALMTLLLHSERIPDILSGQTTWLISDALEEKVSAARWARYEAADLHDGNDFGPISGAEIRQVAAMYAVPTDRPLRRLCGAIDKLSGSPWPEVVMSLIRGMDYPIAYSPPGVPKGLPLLDRACLGLTVAP